MDTECVSLMAIKAEAEVKEDTKSESNFFIQLEKQEVIKNDFLNNCYYRTVFAQSDYNPTFVSTQNEAQLKSEAIKDMGKMEGIVYEEWRIKNEELDIKEEDLEQKGIRCGNPDETEYPIQIVKSEAIEEFEQIYDVKVEDSAITTEVIIKEEVESDKSFSPDSVAQDCQVKCENYLQEGNDRFCNQTSSTSNLLKILPKPKKKKADFLTCDQCSYKTIFRSHLNRHSRRHRNPEELDMFKCNKCDFRTKYKDSLNSHLIIHSLRDKDPEERHMFKCDKCNFQTIHKTYLNTHYKRQHNNSDDVKKFKCNTCDFRTKYKDSLKSHLNRHSNSNPEERDMLKFRTKYKYKHNLEAIQHNQSEGGKKFKCDQCSYETNVRSHLNTHSLRHKNPEDLDMFKCNKCDFQSKYKDSLRLHLKKHLLRDRNPEELDMLKFRTKYKHNLKAIQHNRSEGCKKFKCDQCSYQANFQSHLNIHSRRHRNPEELDMFKCNKCDFQTKYKWSLETHWLQHNDPMTLRNLNA